MGAFVIVSFCQFVIRFVCSAAAAAGGAAAAAVHTAAAAADVAKHGANSFSRGIRGRIFSLILFQES
jgi:hypothetical protein